MTTAWLTAVPSKGPSASRLCSTYQVALVMSLCRFFRDWLRRGGGPEAWRRIPAERELRLPSCGWATGGVQDQAFPRHCVAVAPSAQALVASGASLAGNSGHRGQAEQADTLACTGTRPRRHFKEVAGHGPSAEPPVKRRRLRRKQPADSPQGTALTSHGSECPPAPRTDQAGSWGPTQGDSGDHVTVEEVVYGEASLSSACMRVVGAHPA